MNLRAAEQSGQILPIVGVVLGLALVAFIVLAMDVSAMFVGYNRLDAAGAVAARAGAEGTDGSAIYGGALGEVGLDPTSARRRCSQAARDAVAAQQLITLTSVDCSPVGAADIEVRLVASVKLPIAGFATPTLAVVHRAHATGGRTDAGR